MKEARFNTQKIPAPLWKRILAYGIDFAIIYTLAILPFRNTLNHYSNYSLLLSQAYDPTIVTITTLAVLLTLFYFVALEYKLHQTLGKMLFNISVESKTELTFLQTLLRNFTKPFPILLFIDTLYLFFTRGHQRLFEKFSSTHVVETRMVLQ